MIDYIQIVGLLFYFAICTNNADFTKDLIWQIIVLDEFTVGSIKL
jgi:hypothetical protein